MHFDTGINIANFLMILLILFISMSSDEWEDDITILSPLPVNMEPQNLVAHHKELKQVNQLGYQKQKDCNVMLLNILMSIPLLSYKHLNTKDIYLRNHCL